MLRLCEPLPFSFHEKFFYLFLAFGSVWMVCLSPCPDVLGHTQSHHIFTLPSFNLHLSSVFITRTFTHARTHTRTLSRSSPFPSHYRPLYFYFYVLDRCCKKRPSCGNRQNEAIRFPGWQNQEKMPCFRLWKLDPSSCRCLGTWVQNFL